MGREWRIGRRGRVVRDVECVRERTWIRGRKELGKVERRAEKEDG